jgi:hypothetical protein
MYTTDTDVLCCPNCGARSLRTEAWEYPHTLHEHRGHGSVWLLWAALLLGAGGVWGLAALGLGRVTGWW